MASSMRGESVTAHRVRVGVLFAGPSIHTLRNLHCSLCINRPCTYVWFVRSTYTCKKKTTIQVCSFFKRETHEGRLDWSFSRCHANKTNIELCFKIQVFTSACVTFLELPHTAECSKYTQQFCVLSLKVGNAVIKREDNSIRRKTTENYGYFL